MTPCEGLEFRVFSAVRYSLNSLKGGYIGDYIGGYDRAYYGGYQEFRLWLM